MFTALIGFHQLPIFRIFEHHTFCNFLDNPGSIRTFDTIFLAYVLELLFQFLSYGFPVVFLVFYSLLLVQLLLDFLIIFSFFSLRLLIFVHVFLHLGALHVLLKFSLVVVNSIIVVCYFAIINDHQIMHNTAPNFGILRLFQSTFEMGFGFLITFIWIYELRQTYYMVDFCS